MTKDADYKPVMQDENIFRPGDTGTANLTEPERMKATLTAFNTIFSRSSNSADFYQETARFLSAAYNATFAFIGLFDDPDNPREISSIAASAQGEVISNFSFPLEGSPTQDVLNKGSLYIESGLAETYLGDDILVKMGLQSFYGTCLVSGEGKAIGAINLSHTSPILLSDWNKSLLEIFAVRIVEEHERRAAQDRLQVSASVMDAIREGVMIVDPDGYIRQVNAQFAKMTGWSRDGILGHHVSALWSDRHKPRDHFEIHEQVLTTGHWSGEIWVKRKNGTVYPELRTMLAIRDKDAGDLKHFVTVMQDISERNYVDERIHRLAYYNPVTDLPNRMLFLENLNQNIAEHRKEKTQFGLLLIDLDGFKELNDDYGLKVGDEVLNQVAERLTKLPVKNFFCSHLASDDFAIIMTGFEADEDISVAISHAADEVLDLIEMPMKTMADVINIKTKIGTVQYPQDGDDARQLFCNAELAVNKSKDQSKTRIVHFDPSLRQGRSMQKEMLAYLRKALDEDLFTMHYQAKTSLTTLETAGYEALIRLKGPDGKFISPAHFIPIAEKSSIIIDIGDWVVRAVCKQAVAWQKAGYEFGRLAINISGRQTLNEAFADELLSVVNEIGAKPEWLELELTETWLMEDPEGAVDILQELRDVGFSLAIDDFGVAYSSMNYLRLFPINKIKIDRSFVKDIDSERSSKAIIAAIVAMGHSLNVKVLAEGIETEAQLEALQELGCDEAQGFYFARPVHPDQIYNIEAEIPRQTA